MDCIICCPQWNVLLLLPGVAAHSMIIVGRGGRPSRRALCRFTTYRHRFARAAPAPRAKIQRIVDVRRPSTNSLHITKRGQPTLPDPLPTQISSSRITGRAGSGPLAKSGGSSSQYSCCLTSSDPLIRGRGEWI